MAYSWQIENATAGQTTVDINIAYLSKNDISITINDIKKELNDDYIWISDTVIKLNSALLGNELIRVYRTTNRNRLWIAFSEGAPFDRNNLDEQNKQFLFISQEISEGVGVAGFNNDINMNTYRIINLGVPINASDAATKSYVDQFTAEAIASGLVASAAAEEAKTAATEAKEALEKFEEITGGSLSIVNSINDQTGDLILNGNTLFTDVDSKESINAKISSVENSIKNITITENEPTPDDGNIGDIWLIYSN